MPNYRRPVVPGGTFLFTVVTQDRRPILCETLARTRLRAAIVQTQRERPFAVVAIVLLPDHLHLMMELPAGDADFSTRLAAIKARFTRDYLGGGGTEGERTVSRAARGGRGVWQARFYDHLIRDEDDFGRHLDYLHYNPVKHGLVNCPHAYPHSSFHRWVRNGGYDSDWYCGCATQATPPNFGWADRGME